MKIGSLLSIGAALVIASATAAHARVIQAVSTSYDEPYCREFTQNVSVGGRMQPGYGVACQQPDGAWQIQSMNGNALPQPVPMQVQYRQERVYMVPPPAFNISFGSGYYWADDGYRYHRPHRHHHRHYDYYAPKVRVYHENRHNHHRRHHDHDRGRGHGHGHGRGHDRH